MSLRVLDVVRNNGVAQEMRPAHWANASGTNFKNPWSSFREMDWTDGKWIAGNLLKGMAPLPADLATRMPVRKPVWDHGEAHKDEVKTTWLGHAAFLIEMPHHAGAERGIRILTDPVLGDYCAPVSATNLDYKTIHALFRRPRIPHIFAPRGNEKVLKSFGVPASHLHILDWWEKQRIELVIPSSTSIGGDQPGGAAKATQRTRVDIQCVPAQHNSGRTPLDRMRGQPALWSGWAFEEVVDGVEGAKQGVDAEKCTTTGKKVYFAGDTAYKALWDGRDEKDCPSCPAFKEIGERFGGFDVALLPIGCYLPRRFMSPMHASPGDSVNIFKDVRAKRAVAMHWGTWVLSDEPVLEPPQLLKQEAAAAGLADDAFTACEIGETRFY
ncbi:Metallo-hydrolase/oxidoreductase [Schizophyllum commune Loenen D]|nr:Metallo-hydrolase/oxidoreductase [Schizophyllum commune Loenen D]